MPPKGKRAASRQRNQVSAAKRKRASESSDEDFDIHVPFLEDGSSDDDDDGSDDSGNDNGGPVGSLEPKQKNPQGQHKMNLSNPNLKYRDSITGMRCDKTNPNRYLISILGDMEQHGGGYASKSSDDAVREANDSVVQAAQAFLARTKAGLGPSDQQNQDRIRRFEEYCVVNHPNDTFTQELRTLEKICDMKEKDRPPKRKFPAPPETLVVAWMVSLKKNRKKSGTIRVYVSALNALCAQYGECCLGPKYQRCITAWEKECGSKLTCPFDMVEDLANLYSACWSMSYWGEERKLLCWTMFLVSICMFARASEVTRFCPLFEDIELPVGTIWDRDGYPPYIYVVLRNWKKRSPSNRGKPYKMKIWRNYMKACYCPVLFLLKWLHYSGISSGPIFQMSHTEAKTPKKPKKIFWAALSEGQWTGMTTRLFIKAELYNPETKEGCTNHSIRKTAAQWSGRCKGNVVDAKNNGRWKTTDDLSHYMSQGAKASADHADMGANDPIWKTWVWKPVTTQGDGKDEM